ncbi:MAG: RNA polymerase subunit sigma [Leptolyngbya foveolarum]|uniref:RNA polymerase subunit sigma n=1 Tax=Leptolyngbya foveolarum TaxID=47253 RepID=A0A2W4W865_9CYAN|nr:MAG: RNA polymerase subunit sigma [Leptolyngbya foveolarum]
MSSLSQLSYSRSSSNFSAKSFGGASLHVVPPAAEAPTNSASTTCASTTCALTTLSNNELIIRCQELAKKDRPAFEELVSRYQRYVDKLLYHLASDWTDRADLAQEVWIRVYRSIHRLKEPVKFKSWLGRITTNLFYDELRRRKRYQGFVSLDAPRYSSDGQYDWELPSEEPTPADIMMTQEFHDHLKQAMQELPEVFQKTIAMRELQGLSYEEIANTTGVSLGTVKSRIARARQRLQEKLSAYLVAGEASAR